MMGRQGANRLSCLSVLIEKRVLISNIRDKRKE